MSRPPPPTTARRPRRFLELPGQENALRPSGGSNGRRARGREPALRCAGSDRVPLFVSRGQADFTLRLQTQRTSSLSLPPVEWKALHAALARARGGERLFRRCGTGGLGACMRRLPGLVRTASPKPHLRRSPIYDVPGVQSDRPTGLLRTVDAGRRVRRCAGPLSAAERRASASVRRRARPTVSRCACVQPAGNGFRYPTCPLPPTAKSANIPRASWPLAPEPPVEQ